ncbi:MAG: tetratricopeptide repeat protein [Gemmataceae bacterium]|nr:tetratricopeptide repeat protein [Gemmataceae bacterium]
MSEELPVELHAEIDRLANEGNSLMETGNYAEAAAVFRRGLELLPRPRERWSAALWFLCGIGDAQWFAGDHENGRDTWRDALLSGGLGNPFVHLRRGQTLYELGDQNEAGNELLRALLLGGEEVFANQPRKSSTGSSSPPSLTRRRGGRAGRARRGSSREPRSTNGSWTPARTHFGQSRTCEADAV